MFMFSEGTQGDSESSDEDLPDNLLPDDSMPKGATSTNATPKPTSGPNPNPATDSTDGTAKTTDPSQLDSTISFDISKYITCL